MPASKLGKYAPFIQINYYLFAICFIYLHLFFLFYFFHSTHQLPAPTARFERMWISCSLNSTGPHTHLPDFCLRVRVMDFLPLDNQGLVPSINFRTIRDDLWIGFNTSCEEIPLEASAERLPSIWLTGAWTPYPWVRSTGMQTFVVGVL